jgi:nicotinate-nucleotide--dimethylbenzimidazole phosphoribosyltransferase
LGGFEIAALVGAYIGSAQQGVPVLVDGFISTAAAAIAVALQPTLAPWLLYAHLSNESGHKLALDKLNAQPILALDMRLGEGSGAALAAGVVRQALALHNTMATFADAGVSHAD